MVNVLKDIAMVPVSDIIPYEKNAKIHDEDQIKKLAKNIKRHGFVQPLVIDKNNVIVIGHGRFLGAKKAGMDAVPCLRAEHLSDKEIKALRLADNKLNESSWDFNLLNLELTELDDFGMDDFGFNLTLDFDSEDKPQPSQPSYDTGNQWAGQPSFQGGGNESGLGQRVGEGREIDINDYQETNFRCKCPRCGFLFNDGV